MTTETKPWAAPGLSVEARASRLVGAATRWAHGDADRPLADTLAEALRSAHEDALEEAALMVAGDVPDDPLRQDMEDRNNLGLAELIRTLKDKP